ncbi:MAG TPA: DUF1616 domain-containing protein [Candidatus Methanofastidiosa archaeon]|nr:DUF1616 domain-containing protein [Candidatus Methanofastidiosa archaeon]
MTKNDDLVTIAIATALTIVSVVLDIPIFRQVFGIAFILFCPGYAFISALFVKRREMDYIERIALSFGLSLAIVPLIGLALNYTPYGIRLSPILICNSGFTFAMLFVAFYRRMQMKEDDDGNEFGFTYSMPDIDLGENRTDRILSVILIISIIVSICTLVYVIQAPKKGETFTEFYILGPGGMADDYPTEYVFGETREVIIGIVNHEYETVTYTASMVLEGEVLWTKEYTIEDEGETEETIEITPHLAGENMKLQFLLYKDGEEYRDLHLWITVTEP